MCTPHLRHASLDPPESISQSHFCTAHDRESPYFRMCRPCPPQNCPFCCEDLGLHQTHGSFGPTEFTSQMTCRFVLLFLRGRDCDRQIDYATPSVTIGCTYVVLRCGLIIMFNNRSFRFFREKVCIDILVGPNVLQAP